MKFISNALSLFIIAALAVMVFHSKPEQQAAKDLSEDGLFCMVQKVYHEARGEDVLDQAAVAHVTLNRVRSPAYPDTVCGVVWQIGQFSWTLDGRSDRMTHLDAISKAVDIVLAASRGKIKDPTGGARYYYAHDKVKPYWSEARYRLIVGEHTFVGLGGNGMKLGRTRAVLHGFSWILVSSNTSCMSVISHTLSYRRSRDGPQRHRHPSALHH